MLHTAPPLPGGTDRRPRGASGDGVSLEPFEMQLRWHWKCLPCPGSVFVGGRELMCSAVLLEHWFRRTLELEMVRGSN